MTVYGCVCEWFGSAYEASLWGSPFWCRVCRNADYDQYIRAYGEVHGGLVAA